MRRVRGTAQGSQPQAVRASRRRFYLHGRSVRIDGPPFLLSETPARVSGPGPLLGEHTDDVLSGVLGSPEAEIRELRAAGIVR